MAAFAAGRTPTRFVGRVGDDEAGRLLTAELAAAGVDVRVQRGGATGTIVVLVTPDGERTMFPDRGASAALVHIDTSWLERTAVLHVPAYGLAGPHMRQALLDAATVRAVDRWRRHRRRGRRVARRGAWGPVGCAASSS